MSQGLSSYGSGSRSNRGVPALRHATPLGSPSGVSAPARSMRPDLIGESYAAALAELQDNVAPFDTAVARGIIESELGAPVDEVFSSISPQPIASASLGQVRGRGGSRAAGSGAQSAPARARAQRRVVSCGGQWSGRTTDCRTREEGRQGCRGDPKLGGTGRERVSSPAPAPWPAPCSMAGHALAVPQTACMRVRGWLVARPCSPQPLCCARHF